MGTDFNNSIIKDIFTPVAKIVIGFITCIELYYIFIQRFEINPSLINEITKFNLSIYSLIIFAVLFFIVGYVTCLLGLGLLNLFTITAKALFNEKFNSRLLPLDPFYKGYKSQEEYAKQMFKKVCGYLKLNYHNVGFEFMRLSNIVALENPNLFKNHIFSFDVSIRRGLMINSILLLYIAFMSSNIVFICFSFILIAFIYWSNKDIVENYREFVYDLAFFTASKKEQIGGPSN